MYPPTTSSSPDPLALSPTSSPTRSSQSLKARGPLTSRSSNACSPSKSMILDSGDQDGKSPWRIRVTVQAESTEHESLSSSPKRNTRRNSKATKTIPLKEFDGGSPVKQRTREKKSNATSPASKDRSARKPTPPRRKLTSTPSARSGLEDKPSATHDTEQGIAKLAENAMIHNVAFPVSSGPQAREEADEMQQSKGDETMWRSMATVSAQSTNFSRYDDQCPDYSLGEEEDAACGAQEVPGDLTCLENEEFSMISVDSLTSAQPYTGTSPMVPFQSAPLPSLLAQSMPVEAHDVSFMPSSPPMMLNDRRTPLMEESSPALPAIRKATNLHPCPILPPLRESVVRSGKVLQDIVRSPEPRQGITQHDIARRSIFGGFSTGTRKQLRKSLQVGAELAGGQTSPGKESSPIRPRTQLQLPPPQIKHRLPTPDEQEDEGVKKSFSTDSEAGIVYPSLTGEIRRVRQASPRATCDAMSWIPTGEGLQGVKIDSGKRELDLRGAETQRDIKSAQKPIFDISSDDSDDEDENDSIDGVTNDKDIWQEEASRTTNGGDEPAVTEQVNDQLDALIRPRRSKLPGTWRRQSANHFHYSDSPEPEELDTRKFSHSHSTGDLRKSSGALTPPGTEDEAELGEEQDDVQSRSNNLTVSDSDIVRHQVEAPQFRQEEALSPLSECSVSGDSLTSPECEDTGMFWHSNLPSVFTRRERPHLRRKDQIEHSMVSELRAPQSSAIKRHNSVPTEHSPQAKGVHRSPLRMQPVTGAVKQSTETASLRLNTPLRTSLLRSSKVRGSPLAKGGKFGGSSASLTGSSPLWGTASASSWTEDDRTDSEAYNEEEEEEEEKEMDHHDETDQQETGYSVASDARQLINEMTTAHRRAIDDDKHSKPSVSDEIVFEDDTPTVVTQSYEEELNLDSPAKIAVKFNDSTPPPSLLKPKKVFPPLFGAPPQIQLPLSRQVPDHSPTTAVFPTSKPKRPDTGVLARMGSSFWSTVAKPLIPPTDVTSETTNTSTAATHSSASQATIPDSVLRVRKKYGLLSDVHPFTFAHVRTLHRMLNSVRSHPANSIVPSSGALPSDLKLLVGKTASNSTNQTFTWTPRYVHIVAAFMSLLLPEDERTRVQENGMWGDEVAKKARGFDPRGRHGDWRVFDKVMVGPIKSAWVADVMLEIVWKEERDGAKRGVPDVRVCEK